MEPTPGGTILEAEDADEQGSVIDTRHFGYTGEGYIRSHSESRPYVEWTYDAPADGRYTLEFRYATTWWSGFTKLPLTINGDSSTNFQYYRTGSPSSWNSDRVHTVLKKGKIQFDCKPTAL